jgi:hypothetical protein
VWITFFCETIVLKICSFSLRGRTEVVMDSGRIAPEPLDFVVYLQAVTMISTRMDGLASSA